MKHLLPLLPVAMFPALLCAQPVIDQSDAPQAGDIFPYISANYVPVTITGPDTLWDLSGIETGTPTDLPCEAADATIYGDLYPTATIAFDGGSTITYMRTDAAGLYTVGAYKDLGTQSIQIHYTDESLYMPYPCTYGTTFSDPYTYTYTASVGVVNGGGTIYGTSNGFGNLVLPYDTIYNVLELAYTDTSEESIPGTDYLSVIHEVQFYKPGIHYYVLRTAQISQSVNGGPPQTGFGLFYLAQSAFTGIHEGLAKAIGIEVWPNPARDFVNVTYGIAGGHKVRFVLYDAIGHSVRTQKALPAVSGIQQTRMDVQGLSSGMYLLKVTDDHGQQGSCRVVIK